MGLRLKDMHASVARAYFKGNIRSVDVLSQGKSKLTPRNHGVLRLALKACLLGWRRRRSRQGGADRGLGLPRRCRPLLPAAPGGRVLRPVLRWRGRCVSGRGLSDGAHPSQYAQ